MNDEGGKTILGRTKTKLLTTNKEELKDGITPLRSMQEVVGCCISTSLSIISFLSISFSFLLNFFSCLTLFPNSFLSFSSFSFLSCSSSSLNSCSNFSLSFCSLLWILILIQEYCEFFLLPPCYLNFLFLYLTMKIKERWYGCSSHACSQLTPILNGRFSSFFHTRLPIILPLFCMSYKTRNAQSKKIVFTMSKMEWMHQIIYFPLPRYVW